jgi:hypothetical protein
MLHIIKDIWEIKWDISKTMGCTKEWE